MATDLEMIAEKLLGVGVGAVCATSPQAALACAALSAMVPSSIATEEPINHDLVSAEHSEEHEEQGVKECTDPQEDDVSEYHFDFPSFEEGAFSNHCEAPPDFSYFKESGSSTPSDQESSRNSNDSYHQNSPYQSHGHEDDVSNDIY